MIKLHMNGYDKRRWFRSTPRGLKGQFKGLRLAVNSAAQSDASLRPRAR